MKTGQEPTRTGLPRLKARLSLRLDATCWLLPVLLLLLAIAPSGSSQSLLKTMPGYANYLQMRRARTNISLGALNVTWTEEGRALEYRKGGKRYRYDIAARRATELSSTNRSVSRQTARSRSDRRGQTARPGRGRQYNEAVSPDGRFKAFYRDCNLWLCETNGANEAAITTKGSEKNRIKYGTASWVYGEELDQNTAMWWSSNSQKLAFYRFEESQIRDYYVALDQTHIQDRLEVEPYPKAGATNPVVDLLIYDLTTKKTRRADVRSGESCQNSVLGYYVYGISWSADGTALLFHRTNRRQNIMELCAARP